MILRDFAECVIKQFLSLFLGSFSEWINCNPESLSFVVPLVLQGLGDPEIATSATMSLKELTRENHEHIKPYIPQILSASQVSYHKHIKPIHTTDTVC